MQATYKKYILNFKRPSGTSRGVLTVKETWFIKIEDGDNFGYGECGILRGLSIDDRSDYETKLKWACENIHLGKNELWEALIEFPSIQFGIEMAFQSLKNENEFELFSSAFTKGEDAIAINGLIWMGEKDFMKSQIEDKLRSGFNCIKMKIGAIDFDTEIELLKYIRAQYSAEEIELRVDANGAFDPKNALEKLKRLSELKLHSIEQPIKQGNWEEMAKLCAETPLPIALDEELIGVFDVTKKKTLLQTIQPQYLIFKPSLIGGFKGTQQWIDLAENNNIGWWNTSALESNIGLNAISQFTYEKNVTMPQGLGTGNLYTNNVESPLEVKNGQISYNPGLNWCFKF
ncbi:MAG: o-succinylbenzoate synthase [Zunongwangia sp.]|uniref:O-succinylbenzoate synthase n=1 Tax=Zunongwangia profunda TaxID=398743 RepID=A0A3D5J6C5_9FLAO|nr:o-succinylbenzoate synthase [Zunongwangia profunda]MAC64581.1 o-succinylbenzoate synthase [Flavobacteriaceae bacterium]MAO38555.1 o-succinylbenzoate synthase [Zunongwangia sp.]MCC4230798.1 o-succinylbenzoate synthase [Zunongwangia profunda]HAJ81051.1 o-succinylbenzoate synthase [Zunongwangia profunda]HCV82816.1 o-succinylbenzoate synthase [Zunongwangia profunda]